MKTHIRTNIIKWRQTQETHKNIKTHIRKTLEHEEQNIWKNIKIEADCGGDKSEDN